MSQQLAVVDDTPKRARSLSPTRENRGRSRSRDVPQRRISRSAGRASQQVWALNPMMNVEDPSFELAAGEGDDSFREAVSRARASHSRNSSPGGDHIVPLRSNSPPERMSSSVPRASWSGEALIKPGNVPRSSWSDIFGKPRASYHGSPSFYGDSSKKAPSSPDNSGRKLRMYVPKPPPDLELKLVSQKSEELVLAIAVEPPPQEQTPSKIGRSLMGKNTLEKLKRSSRSATEAVTILPGTRCSHCQTLIPGTFDSGQDLECANSECKQSFKAGERLHLAECQACFTWAQVSKGVTRLKCEVCGINVELFPMFAGDIPEINSRHSESKSGVENAFDDAVHGLLSAWERIREGAQALLPHPVRSVFVNWSATIVTDFAVLEPESDDDIRKLIFEAQAAGLTLRVLGHGHTQSPAVCNNNEPGVLLIRLNQYRQPTNGIPDFEWVSGEHGDATRDVRINAGWSIGQLYAETVSKGYFLFSQTAASPFSIGGFYMNTVHGSAHTESLMSTRCVGLRVIKYDGSVLTIDKERDLRYWRSSFGAGGVTTHVTIRMRRFTSIENSHVSYQIEMTPEKIQTCIFDSLVAFHACEFFWNPYTDELVTARWRGENNGGPSNFEKSKKKLKRASVTHGMSVGGNAFAQIVPGKHFRAKQVNMAAAFAGLEHFLRREASAADTMFLLDWVPRCVFMAYFIPVHSAWDIIRAMRAVSDVVEWGKTTVPPQPYGLNCPLEFRFVRGNSNAVFTPIWEPEKPDSKEDPNVFTTKQLYLNIEVIAYTEGLDQKFGPDSHLTNPLTASWQEFWYRVEQNWRKIEGAKPHPAKLFGIEPRPEGGYRAFAPSVVHNVWSSAQKKVIRKWVKDTDPPQVFQRQFLKHLLAEPSPLDRIDSDAILLRASRLPDATKTTINNVNDYKGCWFLLITLPYWLSGMVVHAAGFMMFLALVILGLFEGQCNEAVLGYVIRDCGHHPLCTETALHWIQAWFLFRGLIGLMVAPFHLVINCRRFTLLCKQLKGRAAVTLKPNSDDNSKAFWRCVPICDIMISFTLGFGMISLQHTFECGLVEFFGLESLCLLVLLAVLGSRIFLRLKGQYYRFFHYNGNGAFFAQKSFKGSWNPWTRLNDNKFM